jgi:hydroxyacylglutathione hydrolase
VSDGGNGDDPWAGLATGSYPVVGFGDLKAYIGAPGEVVLDVRLGREWREGHLATASHIPLHELPDRIDEVPAGRVWAHCAAGYRAAVAGSLLARAGRDVMVVSDQYSNAVDVGLDIVSSCD